MRGTANVLVVCIVVAFTLATSAIAQNEQRAPTGSAVGPTQGGTMAPPATIGKIAPVSKEECSSLGGWMISAIASCKSMIACETTDKDGVKHDACLKGVDN